MDRPEQKLAKHLMSLQVDLRQRYLTILCRELAQKDSGVIYKFLENPTIDMFCRPFGGEDTLLDCAASLNDVKTFDLIAEVYKVATPEEVKKCHPRLVNPIPENGVAGAYMIEKSVGQYAIHLRGKVRDRGIPRERLDYMLECDFNGIGSNFTDITNTQLENLRNVTLEHVMEAEPQALVWMERLLNLGGSMDTQNTARGWDKTTSGAAVLAIGSPEFYELVCNSAKRVPYHPNDIDFSYDIAESYIESVAVAQRLLNESFTEEDAITLWRKSAACMYNTGLEINNHEVATIKAKLFTNLMRKYPKVLLVENTPDMFKYSVGMLPGVERYNKGNSNEFAQELVTSRSFNSRISLDANHIISACDLLHEQWGSLHPKKCVDAEQIKNPKLNGYCFLEQTKDIMELQVHYGKWAFSTWGGVKYFDSNGKEVQIPQVLHNAKLKRTGPIPEEVRAYVTNKILGLFTQLDVKSIKVKGMVIQLDKILESSLVIAPHDVDI